MNIFYIDERAHICAQNHCDKHVAKMILETAQMLSTAHHVLDPAGSRYAVYRKTHENHPCAKWIRSGVFEYMWAFVLLENLCDEYTHRYGKIHKTSNYLSLLQHPPETLPNIIKWTQPPKCMPEEFKVESVQESYRNYYRIGKKHLLKYTKREPPRWLDQ